MKITYTEIEEVRQHNKQKLHDKEWWDFEDREKTSAISYALNYKEPYDTNKEIRTRALEYADAVTS